MKKEKRKGKSKAKKISIPLQEAATSSSTRFDKDDFEEEEGFYETHCHWENCDKGDFGTQDALVKVRTRLNTGDFFEVWNGVSPPNS